jgi:signal transduction histidine kinase
MMRIARRSGDEPEPRDELDALLRAGRAAAEETDLEPALEAILDAAIGLVGGDEGSVMLLDRATMQLSVVAARGLGPEERRQRVALGQGISGAVAAAGEPVLLPSAIDIDRFIGHVPKKRAIFASMCVPLRTHGEKLGVLCINQMRPGRTFTQRDLQLVTVFAETAAQTIANARLSNAARRHAVELEILRGAMVRLGSSLDLTQVAETILQEALTLTGSTAAFLAVSPREDAPPSLVRFAGIPRDAMRVVLARPGFRHLRLPDDIRMVADVPGDPVFAPFGPAFRGCGLALVPLRAADGRIGGLLGVGVPNDPDGQTRRLLGTYGTQAGLALANAALHAAVRTSADELDTIVTALDLPIVLIDEHNAFRAINPAASAALRLSPEFEIGQDAHGKLPPAIEALVLDRLGDVTADVVVTIAGEQRAFHLTTASVAGAHGRVTRIAAFSDITRHHELEQQKGDFLAVIGHELRTPLTSIKGFAWTLAKRADDLDPKTRGEVTHRLLVQSERLERLIEDLLYVSGIEQARPPVHLAWENVSDILGDIIAEVSRRAPARMIRSHIGGEEPLYTDRVKVEQILNHLLDNALKFSDDDSFVDVRLTAEGRWLSIAVTDEGAGIYSGDLERIFEPFTQVDGSSTRRVGGTGVGLFVARTLADALDGRIEVSSALGKGSTFTLILPRREPDDQSE